MKLQSAAGCDFTKLPDEVLRLIYLQAITEIDRRRMSVKKTTHSTVKLLNRTHSIRSPHRAKQLPLIVAEDWNRIYPATNSEKKFYVYAHVEPIKGGFKIGEFDFKGLPFYIGKGAGARAFDLKRNEGHGAELRRLIASGRSSKDIVVMLADGLTESEALCLEAKLIYFFGTRYDGKKNGVLVNLTKPPTPDG
jgi:hypothetical protein